MSPPVNDGQFTGSYVSQNGRSLSITGAPGALPNDAASLNGRCWARAIWGRQLDAALAECDAALRMAPNDAAALDSRGLVHLRRGEFQAALADYDAALHGNADQVPSQYGRGIARVRLGQAAEGRADIAAANARDASLAVEFEGYGLTP